MSKYPEDMVFIGEDQIKKMIKQMEITTRELAAKLDLSLGGLYYITHKSGKMDIKIWRKFKKIYELKSGKKSTVDESSFDMNSRKKTLITLKNKQDEKKINLKKIDTQVLIDELRRRGIEFTGKYK